MHYLALALIVLAACQSVARKPDRSVSADPATKATRMAPDEVPVLIILKMLKPVRPQSGIEQAYLFNPEVSACLRASTELKKPQFRAEFEAYVDRGGGVTGWQIRTPEATLNDCLRAAVTPPRLAPGQAGALKFVIERTANAKEGVLIGPDPAKKWE